ncbi:MAG TPA: AlkA N-terminal domain-containing protein [Solirubrobacteraceae bacterium]|jgi:AraC family transcriptional regulator of adaptative response / DNA-3-methyladenine glycosylase II|nr:AlkA N-terminal domain-containing protein [Solirubrobacteraceae bacterium]
MTTSESRETASARADTLQRVPLELEHCYRITEAQDPRFDGWLYCGVTSTGIYCRPSCPARTPKRENLRFYATAAAAQAAGFRACKRCRPDAVPGSPEWDARADVAGRAMRLIADGVVDREGVAGLSRRLGYSERHLHRQLVETVGVGPLALARARRARTARLLLESTDLSITDVAFAAGFRSIRQFNLTIREVYAETPRALRERRGARGASGEDGAIVVRLPSRAPTGTAGVLRFLAARAVPGVEEMTEEGAYRRSLRLPNGAGVVELAADGDDVRARLWLDDVRDLATALERCRRLLDLDSDPHAVREALEGDAVIGHLVREAPGLRVPGHVDGAELAIRAVLGQQVSVAGATTNAARLAAAFGEPLRHPVGGVTHLFPVPEALLDAPLALPGAQSRTLRGLCSALAAGELALGPGADPHEAERRLGALPGIGPWTVNYVAMRALRCPDAFLAADLGVRRAVERLGHPGDPRSVERLSERWRPYRAYANQHLWAASAAHVAARAAPAALAA